MSQKSSLMQSYKCVPQGLTSDNAEDIIHEGRLNAEGLKMLRKPYRFAELAAMVRETLEAS